MFRLKAMAAKLPNTERRRTGGREDEDKLFFKMYTTLGLSFKTTTNVCQPHQLCPYLVCVH